MPIRRTVGTVRSWIYANVLRPVVLTDCMYDRGVPLQARGVSLDRMFSPAMLKGSYRKKYLRAICPA
jgi:cell division protein ZapE